MSASQNIKKNTAFPPWIIVIIAILSLAVIGTAALLIYTILSENNPTLTNGGAPEESSSYASSEINSSDDTSSANTSSEETSSKEQLAEREINEEYTKLFSDLGITPRPIFNDGAGFSDYDAYVKLDTKTLDEYQSFYKEGRIAEIYRLLYYSHEYIKEYLEVSVLTTGDLDSFIRELETSDAVSEIAKMGNISIKIEKVENAVLITQHITKLDEEEYRNAQFGTTDVISRNDMIRMFQNAGYVNKYKK